MPSPPSIICGKIYFQVMPRMADIIIPHLPLILYPLAQDYGLRPLATSDTPRRLYRNSTEHRPLLPEYMILRRDGVALFTCPFVNWFLILILLIYGLRCDSHLRSMFILSSLPVEKFRLCAPICFLFLPLLTTRSHHGRWSGGIFMFFPMIQKQYHA
ncbi:hypothetical protein F5Y14DRAFT_91610 [Nemania sp. NC0429]|nr:hypothetical protein F5Y14DRAFT_91610 [Nemania sp. NC0429]